MAVSDLVLLADRARAARQRHVPRALAPLILLEVAVPNDDSEVDTMVRLAERAWSTSKLAPPAPVEAYRRWLEERRRQTIKLDGADLGQTSTLQEQMDDWEEPPPEAALLVRLYNVASREGES